MTPLFNVVGKLKEWFSAIPCVETDNGTIHADKFEVGEYVTNSDYKEVQDGEYSTSDVKYIIKDSRITEIVRIEHDVISHTVVTEERVEVNELIDPAAVPECPENEGKPECEGPECNECPDEKQDENGCCNKDKEESQNDEKEDYRALYSSLLEDVAAMSRKIDANKENYDEAIKSIEYLTKKLEDLEARFTKATSPFPDASEYDKRRIANVMSFTKHRN